MVISNFDKQALKENSYTVLSRITIVGTNIVFTEEDAIVDWNYEDYRYVPGTGFIGQFVERILDGNLQNISEDIILEDKEINLQIGIVNGLNEQTTWYDCGNFLITKVSETDTTGNFRFESADYTKKFNITYEDNIIYPTISLALVNNVCTQADVELSSDGYCHFYIIPTDGLTSGNYNFYYNGTYYNFTLANDLNFYDTLMYIESTETLILKTIDSSFNVTRTNLEVSTDGSATGTTLVFTRIPYVDFINNDFVIENNQYESEDTCRKVMQDIGKLAYSWVRVAENNKVYIDFQQQSEENVDRFDELSTDEYYTSKKSDLYFGPVNKVLIGMKDVDGENLYKTSGDYTEETECSLKIFDNNLTYTEELRAIALDGCENLFGLKYMPLEIETIGHPWLEGNELIKLTNVDEEELYTYPFNRKIKYAGYIEEVIGAEAQTSQETEYEYTKDIISDVKKTRFIVDKDNQRIDSLIERTEDSESRITELEQTTEGITATVEHLNDEYEENVVIKKTTDGNPIEVDDAGNYQLNDFKIYGNTEQNGTPTPTNPVDIETITSKEHHTYFEGDTFEVQNDYDESLEVIERNDMEFSGNTTQYTTTGKNLLPPTIATNTKNGITLTNNGDGSYTLNGTATANTTFSIALPNELNGTYTAQGNNPVANSGVSFRILNSSNTSALSMTLNAINKQNVGATITGGTQQAIRIENGTTLNNFIVKPMLQSGSSATSWEKYTGGQASPNPTFPQQINNVTGLQEVDIVGKNYINSKTLNSSCSSIGSINLNQSDDYLGVNGLVKVEPNTTYTITFYDYNNLTSMPTLWLGTYDKNKTFIARVSQVNTRTFTTDSNTYYIFPYLYSSRIDFTNINGNVQLERGSQATDFEEYKGKSYEINLGKNLLDLPNQTSTNSGLTSVISNNVLTTTGTTTATYHNASEYQTNNFDIGTYTFSIENSVSFIVRLRFYNSDNSTAYSFDIPANSKSVLINLPTKPSKYRILYSGLTNNTQYNVEIKYQLEKGSKATSYSPYFTPIELCKIGTYQDYIFKGKGVNLFDKDNANILNGMYIDGTNSKIASSTGTKTLYIPIIGGTTYTVSKIVSQRFSIATTRVLPTGNVAVYNRQTDNTGTNLTINTTSEDKYLCVFYLHPNDTISEQTILDSIMIQKGSQATPYEPYNSKDKWLLHKEIGKYVANDDFGNNGENEVLVAFVTPILNIGANVSSPDLSSVTKCNLMQTIVVNNTGLSGTTAQNRIRFNISKNDFPTISGMTAVQSARKFINDNKFTVYYGLLNPTTTEITNSELIEELENINSLEFFDGINYYTTTSSNLPIKNKFTITDTNYEIVTISDENDNTLTHRILMKDFELCEIGNYRDYLYFDSGKWYKHCEIGKVVLNGSETGWNLAADTTNLFLNNNTLISGQYLVQNGYSNNFKNIVNTDITDNFTANNNLADNQFTFRNGTKDRIYIKSSAASNVNDFKTWLNTHNTIVYYVLANPTTEEIEDTTITNTLNEILQSYLYKGYNKIYLHDEIADKIEITYLTDSILNSTYAAKTQLTLTEESLSATVERTTALENNVTNLQLGIEDITTEVISVKDITSDLENSINYLNIELSGNSIIIPTNDENLPYISTTYNIPYTATFKGASVTPTVTTADTATGITISFATEQIKVGVSTTAAITSLTNTFNINFTYINEGQTYLVTKAINVGLSVKGEDGKDGTSVTILGSYDTLAQLQAAHPTGSAGDSYMVGDDLYVWSVTASAWVDVGQIRGDDGISSYVYIRYSENETGNPMTTSPTSTSKYIGLATTNSSSAPTSYTSYTWSQYAGTDGETTYVHIKYSEDGSTFVEATDDAGEGDTPSAWVGVLTDTNEEASTTFDDYTWYKFTEDIDAQLTELQNSVSENKTNIENNYTAIIEQLDDYAKADVVATLKQTVETNQSNTDYAISIINDLQVNGVSQVRTEKGFTFNDNGLTIDETNSVTKGKYDTNGVTIVDKTGSSNSEVFFAGYDEETHTSIVRTNNLSVSTYFNIGTKSRFEDYEDGTGVFI